MRVGIIGGGQIAGIHGRVIVRQANSEVVGVADKDIGRARTLATELNANQFYRDAKVMIDEQKPDVVHVLAPPQYHAELTIMAMNEGCHVLVEKPMALSVHDAEEMIDVAKRKKVHLCVDHNMVFEDIVERAVEWASMGVVGELVSVEASYLYDARRYPAILEEGAEYSHWCYRLKGGPLQDQMPHPASFVMEFIREIKEIQWIGHNRRVLPEPWQDEIRVLIKSNSVIGYISISLSERPDRISLAIKGTKGIVEANLFNGILTFQRKSSLPRVLARGVSGFELGLQHLRGSLGNIYKFATGGIDKSGGIQKVVSKFYESIRNDSEVPVSLDKSLRVVDLMNRVWPARCMDAERPRVFFAPRRKYVAPTAFVTGASGFIGTHLVKKLRCENIGVRALVRPNSAHAGRLKRIDVDIVEGNLESPEVLHEATRGIRVVYHTGAAMSNDWHEQYNSTVKGTEHLITAALAHQVERFVHVSTLGIYELSGMKKDGVVKEGCPYQSDWKRMSAYAHCKIEAEKLIFDAYRKDGLPATVVRPGIVIGPMGRVLFPQIGYHYQGRVFLIVGRGDVILPLSYVENTVDGIYLASTGQEGVGQAYNLVDDGRITVREYVEQLRKITGIRGRVVCVPYMIPYIGTAAYEIVAASGLVKGGMTSRQQLKWKQARVRFANDKAKRELGWKPRVSIEEGLRRTFEWWYRSEKG